VNALEHLLLIDKPSDWTSHDVVAKIRGLFPRKTKVGHCGTLDPAATGLLVLLIGKATKLASAYQGLDKVYTGSIRLGTTTDSGDLEGKEIRKALVPPTLDDAALQALFDKNLGEIDMIVPKYSAVKVAGKPLYKYARQGKEAPEVRRVSRIDAFRLTGYKAPEARFSLTCSSGTYVRALAMRLGEQIGCGATLSALRRESIGAFPIEDAMTVEAAVALAKAEGVEALLAKGLVPVSE
jgi:tRNA pseudouridine55 synthase